MKVASAIRQAILIVAGAVSEFYWLVPLMLSGDVEGARTRQVVEGSALGAVGRARRRGFVCAVSKWASDASLVS
jgi:hypothetical protein